MVRLNSLFVAAAATTALRSYAAEYKVRVRNLSWMQPFSPPLVVAHTDDVSVFNEGTRASDALQLLAENGDNSGLVDPEDTTCCSCNKDPRVCGVARIGMLGSDEDVEPFVCGAVIADDVIMGGDTWRGTMEVDLDVCGDSPRFSMVAMLGNTNDAFVGIDSEDLVSYGVSKSFPPAFDAGTEENNELCEYIPGPACPDVPENLAAGNGEGYVLVHRGVHGIGNLTESVYDWRNPVAEVVIFAP